MNRGVSTTLMSSNSVDDHLALLDRIAPPSLSSEVEIYHRHAMRVRVQQRTASEPSTHHLSDEDGAAVRLWNRLEGRTGFGAVNRFDIDGLRWALQRAGETMGTMEGDAGALQEGNGAPASDDDEDGRLPSISSLESMHRAMLESVTGNIFPGINAEVAAAWTEAGLTVETLVTTTGVRTRRVRIRTWSMLSLRWQSDGAFFERPRLAACRGFGALPVPSIFREAAGAMLCAGRELEFPRSGAVVLAPDASAVLVRAVVRALQTGPGRKTGPAGPAWRVRDVPDLDGALFGGSFDDTGRLTTSNVLADGKSWTTGLHGNACNWRGSYRDRPETMPSNLVVEEGEESMPDNGISLTDLRIHPLGAEKWTLEGLGTVISGGKPSGEGGRCFLTVNPAALVERCSSAIGHAVRSANGVSTPALLFDIG